MTVVADSTPCIYLARLGDLGILQKLGSAQESDRRPGLSSSLKAGAPEPWGAFVPVKAPSSMLMGLSRQSTPRGEVKTGKASKPAATPDPLPSLKNRKAGSCCPLTGRKVEELASQRSSTACHKDCLNQYFPTTSRGSATRRNAALDWERAQVYWAAAGTRPATSELTEPPKSPETPNSRNSCQMATSSDSCAEPFFHWVPGQFLAAGVIR